MVHLCGGVLQIIRTIVAISIEIQLDKSKINIIYSGRRRSEEKQKIGIVESLIGA